MPKIANNEGFVRDCSEYEWNLLQQTETGKVWRIVTDAPPAEVANDLKSRKNKVTDAPPAEVANKSDNLTQ